MVAYFIGDWGTNKVKSVVTVLFCFVYSFIAEEKINLLEAKRLKIMFVLVSVRSPPSLYFFYFFLIIIIIMFFNLLFVNNLYVVYDWFMIKYMFGFLFYFYFFFEILDIKNITIK